MKILVTGANGQIGSEIIKLFASSQHEIIAFTRKELDCTHVWKVSAVLAVIEPDLVINAAAYTAVDKAEDEISLAHIINVEFAQELANYCTLSHIPLIHLSTDYVFDGSKSGAYSETDLPNPRGVYAQSKFAGEQAIISRLREYIILRVSWVFGVYGNNFVKTILNLAKSRNELSIVADQWGKPTAARDIARVLLKVVQKINNISFNEWGIYHYAGEERTSWYEFSRVFIDLAKKRGTTLTLTSLKAITSEEYLTKALRPKNSILNTTKIEQVFNIHCHSWKDYLPEVLDSVIEHSDTKIPN